MTLRRLFPVIEITGNSRDDRENNITVRLGYFRNTFLKGVPGKSLEPQQEARQD